MRVPDAGTLALSIQKCLDLRGSGIMFLFCFVFMRSSCFHCFSPRVSLHLFFCSKDRFTKYNLQRKKKKVFIPEPPATPWPPDPYPAISIVTDLSSSVFLSQLLTSYMFSHLFPPLPLVLGVFCSSDCPSLSYTVCLSLCDGRVVFR